MPSESFFEYECKVPKGCMVKSVAWSSAEPVLALATDSNQVLMFDEEGEMLTEHSISRNVSATTLKWQPRARVLAIGWEDGVVSVWHMRERIQREDEARLHRKPISLLCWNEEGRPESNRLVTGDKEGAVGLWHTDARGRLMPICNFRKSGAITHAIFGHQPEAKKMSSRFVHSFFFAGQLGVVSFGDDLGHCMSVCKVGAPVYAMMYYKERNKVVIINEALTLTQLDIGADGNAKPEKVKLSMNLGPTESNPYFRANWVGPGLLLTSCSEQLLRFWDLGNSINYVINIVESSEGLSLERLVSSKRKEGTGKWGMIKSNLKGIAHSNISAVAFSQTRGTLAAGTRSGHLLMWRFLGEIIGEREGGETEGAPVTGPKSWQLVYHSKLPAAVIALEWGFGDHLLSTKLEGGKIFVLNETALHNCFRGETLAMQVSPNSFVVEQHANGSSTGDISGEGKKGDGAAAPPNETKSSSSDSPTQSTSVQCGIRIRGISIASTHAVVWSGSMVEVYSIKASFVKLVSSFECRARDVAISREALYVAVGSHIKILNVQGVVKQTLSFSDTEGDPQCINILGNFMAAVTDRGVLKRYDTHKIKARQTGSAVQLLELCGATASNAWVKSVRINADGTRASVLLEREHGAFYRFSDTCLYVYYADLNTVSKFEFGPDRYPVSHLWDPVEPRLLVSQAVLAKHNPTVAKAVKQRLFGEKEASGREEKRQAESKSGGSSNQSDENNGQAALTGGPMKKAMPDAADADAVVTTLFATADYGLLAQDTFPIERHRLSLIGIHVPKLFFLAGSELQGKRALKSRLMRDFVGLDKVDDETRKALLEFSYFLTVGNLDAAFRAVRTIDSPAVWQNMAHMCVKTKRLDVAEVCLGNMGHARGAKAVRETKDETDLNTRVAMVAIQLGLLDDAERLYQESNRHDLLNELYQASGQWDKALDTAAEKDRIHLRTTHYQFARHLEATGNVSEAIKHYKSAHTHWHEVPRMLYDAEQLQRLEQYIKASRQDKLYRWWAQFCESNGNLDGAMRYYQLSNDYLSQVRIHCFKREFAAAADLVMEAGDQSRAASFHMGRTHEALGNTKKAMNFFARAGRYNHAVRLAMEHNLDQELMQLALLSPKTIMEDAARYFEKAEQFEKAVQLYQKSGSTPRALELCFSAQLFDLLRTIAEELGEETDPVVLSRCADFFLEHGQHEKAMQMCVAGKKIGKALELAMRHNIHISEGIADKMTMAKKKGDKPYMERRSKQLVELARCCKKQGSFHLACKKYTQAGDKVKAMRCLLKSGDTQKITFFAGVCRKSQIYVLAANYLQSLDWHNNPKIMKSIIQFYTKARAFALLSGFYNACAQVEIDEYRDYGKALQALKEAAKYLNKARGAPQKEEKLEALQQHIFLMERFVQARQLVKTQPAEMAKICRQLLEHPEVDAAVRVGDVFALLIEYHYAANDTRQAMELIENMRERKIIFGPFLDQEMVRTIYEANGAEYIPENQEVDDDDDGIEEDIPMEVASKADSDDDGGSEQDFTRNSK